MFFTYKHLGEKKCNTTTFLILFTSWDQICVCTDISSLRPIVHWLKCWWHNKTSGVKPQCRWLLKGKCRKCVQWEFQHSDADRYKKWWRQLCDHVVRNIKKWEGVRSGAAVESAAQPVIQQLEERLSDFIKHQATQSNFMAWFIQCHQSMKMAATKQC